MPRLFVDSKDEDFIVLRVKVRFFESCLLNDCPRFVVHTLGWAVVRVLMTRE